MSNKYLLASHEAVSQQPFQINERCSPKCSEAPMKFISQTPEAVPLEIVVDARRNAAGRVEDYNDSLDALRHIPCPLAISVSPNPESTASLRACLVNPIHLSDTLLEEDVVNECPTTGCLTLSQAELKAAVKWFPEPQLIDNITALMCARLMAHSMCDEFGPRTSKLQPNKPSVVKQ